MRVQALLDIRKTVVINAPVEKVWEAVATADGIAGWFMPNTFKPVLGQEFVIHAGPFGDSPCQVTHLEPPHVVGFDWDHDWHLEIRLVDRGGNTELTLIHSGWDANKITSAGQPHRVVRDVMDQGWERKVHEDLPAYIQGRHAG